MKKRDNRRLSKEEVAAMKERLKELDHGGGGENEVLEKIAEMKDPDRTIGMKLHSIITSTALELRPRTWYGMPAYSKDDKVICFFQPAGKFKARYATIGFSDKANLDEGNLWPTSFALKKLTAAEEKRIADLVKRAVG